MQKICGREESNFDVACCYRASVLRSNATRLFARGCMLSNALPIERYITTCKAAGVEIERAEEHREALAELVHEIRGRLVAAEVLVMLQSPATAGGIKLPGRPRRWHGTLPPPSRRMLSATPR